MNILDVGIVTIILLSGLISAIRGFTKEVLSLIAWGISIYLALHFAPGLAQSSLIKHNIKTPDLQIALAFIAILVLSLFTLAIINRLLARVVKIAGVGGTDRSLGIVFGLVRGILIVSVVIVGLQLTKAPEKPWWKASAAIPYFQPITVWLGQFIPQTRKTA